MQVLELARCEWIDRRENVIALGPSGTGKTHVALGLGLAVCQKGLSVGFITAAALVHELMEARDERRLLRLQKQMANCKLLIIDELGFVPLSKTGAEVLFELISQRYERGATLITSNLPFDEWTETFGSERLTGALLDRLTHHVNILEMNGDSYRLAQSRGRKGIAINQGQDRLALAGQSAQAPSSGQHLLRHMAGFCSAVDNITDHMQIEASSLQQASHPQLHLDHRRASHSIELSAYSHNSPDLRSLPQAQLSSLHQTTRLGALLHGSDNSRKPPLPVIQAMRFV